MNRRTSFLALLLPLALPLDSGDAYAQLRSNQGPGAKQQAGHRGLATRAIPRSGWSQSYSSQTFFAPAGTSLSFFYGTVPYGFGNWYPYAPYYVDSYYPGPYALPPVFIPPDAIFGPPSSPYYGLNLRSSKRKAARADRDEPIESQDAPPTPNVRVSNASTRAQAGRFLHFGDVHFAKGKYPQALDRYQTASRTAPDLAEAFLRQGAALVATKNYPRAIAAYVRGLRLMSRWTNSPFRLEEMYGNDKATLAAHLELLAAAVEENPHDPQLLTLLGLELFFDGQVDRARVFLQRAAQLGGNDDHLLDEFAPQPAKPDNGDKDRKAAADEL